MFLIHVQESRPAAARDEQLQELSTLKERLAQMTNRMGQMEQKVEQKGCTEMATMLFIAGSCQHDRLLAGTC